MLPGVPVHIHHRGNNRQPCFLADNDRSFYLHHLRRLLPLSGCSLHAYCLMTNHVHLLMTPAGATSCARLMQRLAQLHTQYLNRTYGRTGSLWEGRFRSCLVQTEEYLLACQRYIESNPVRADLCDRPSDYAWSSYRSNAEGMPDDAITQHEQFTALGVTAASRRRAYESLFKSDERYSRIDDIRRATNGNFALGDERFKRRMAIQLGRRVDIGKAGRPVAERPDDDRQLSLLKPAKKNVVCP